MADAPKDPTPPDMHPDLYRDLVAVRIDCLRIAAQDPSIVAQEQQLRARTDMFFRIVTELPPEPEPEPEQQPPAKRK